MESYTVKVLYNNAIGCPRCGADQNHNNLRFQTFLNNAIIAPDGTVFTHFSMCPMTYEPILMRLENGKWVLD
jgi:hypothetical protein